MGIDLLDLTFRLVREFKIKIDREELIQLLKARHTWSMSKGYPTDIQVGDLVALIETNLQKQTPQFTGQVFERVKPHISECLGVKESAVTLDAWLFKDLGME